MKDHKGRALNMSTRARRVLLDKVREVLPTIKDKI